jgi:hypothetical protein
MGGERRAEDERQRGQGQKLHINSAVQNIPGA